LLALPPQEYVITKEPAQRETNSAERPPPQFILTCTTMRSAYFWGLASKMVTGIETRDPFNYCVPGFVDDSATLNFTCKDKAVSRIDSETGEPFLADLWRFVHRFKTPAGVEKFIHAVAQKRPFTIEVFGSPRMGAEGLIMKACGSGDGRVCLGGCVY
jgi:ligand-binding SRPBCC domain-containing protein